MNSDSESYKIICVTDRLACMQAGHDFLTRVEDIAVCGADAVILRERDLLPGEYKELAAKVLEICRRHKVPCILHRFLPEAGELGAEYVHLSIPALRQTSPDMLETFTAFGVSCHSAEDALYAQERGASYILAGHVYDTTCKLGTPGRGLEYLEGICRAVHIPVYAIGGITGARVPQVLAAGAAGICSMSGFMTCDNVREYMQIFPRRSSLEGTSADNTDCLDTVCNNSTGNSNHCNSNNNSAVKRLERESLRLYAITDNTLRGAEEEAERVCQAILGGATMIQLRKKDATQEQLEEYARAASAVCREAGVPFVVNDNVPVALKYADGVHLGAQDEEVRKVRETAPEGFIIGATAKTTEQALAAEAAGADYMGVGAMFPSPTKTGAIRITAEQLNEICSCVSIPAVTIGGISEDNILSLKGCRAAGAAVVSAVFSADNIKAAAERMRALADKAFG